MSIHNEPYLPQESEKNLFSRMREKVYAALFKIDFPPLDLKAILNLDDNGDGLVEKPPTQEEMREIAQREYDRLVTSADNSDYVHYFRYIEKLKNSDGTPITMTNGEERWFSAEEIDILMGEFEQVESEHYEEWVDDVVALRKEDGDLTDEERQATVEAYRGIREEHDQADYSFSYYGMGGTGRDLVVFSLGLSPGFVPSDYVRRFRKFLPEDFKKLIVDSDPNFNWS